MGESRQYWLMKSEPAAYSIDDLARQGKTAWEGVRNYQARNFMRDQMRVGDEVLFYHPNAQPSGVAGLARVCRAAYPDHTAWDPRSQYYDPRSTPQEPIWMMVDVEFREKFPCFVTLEMMRIAPALAGMLVLRRGMRLSVQPVSPAHFAAVCRLGRAQPRSRPTRTGEG